MTSPRSVPPRPAPSPLAPWLVAACTAAAALALSSAPSAGPPPVVVAIPSAPPRLVPSAPSTPSAFGAHVASAASSTGPASSSHAPRAASAPHAPGLAHALPPGASPGDAGPSRVIYPPQRIPLRFDHRKHLALETTHGCASCHPGATTSESAADRLLPAPAVCDGCHGSNHADLSAVGPGSGAFAPCSSCHEGWSSGDGNVVARVAMPDARLRSNHRAHAARNIACESCHGAVQQVGLATRDQLPRMKGCLVCHGMTGPQAGDARGECVTCHLALPDGRMRSEFVDGKLLPPRALAGLEHTPDFLARHRSVAGERSRECASCHAESFCVDCHDGRVRPRGVHPNDYLSLHAVDARLEGPSCASCHQPQTFCLPCHQRAGVTMTAGPGALRGQGRFHPPHAVFSDLPRTRQHHALEAQRNLQACVSCHDERDCAVCHASTAAGGRGFNPHPPGFAARCAAAARRNPRPCLVCHTDDPRTLCR